MLGLGLYYFVSLPYSEDSVHLHCWSLVPQLRGLRDRAVTLLLTALVALLSQQ